VDVKVILRPGWTLATTLRVDTKGLVVIQRLEVDTPGWTLAVVLRVDTMGLTVIWGVGLTLGMTMKQQH